MYQGSFACKFSTWSVKQIQLHLQAESLMQTSIHRKIRMIKNALIANLGYFLQKTMLSSTVKQKLLIKIAAFLAIWYLYQIDCTIKAQSCQSNTARSMISHLPTLNSMVRLQIYRDRYPRLSVFSYKIRIMMSQAGVWLKSKKKSHPIGWLSFCLIKTERLLPKKPYFTMVLGILAVTKSVLPCSFSNHRPLCNLSRFSVALTICVDIQRNHLPFEH